MNEAMILAYTLKTMWLVLVLSLPPIIVAAVVGILTSLFQAVTQIQEQTLSFSLKLIAIIITIIITARWGGSQLLFYAKDLFNTFQILVK